jgi:hypothetical protein
VSFPADFNPPAIGNMQLLPAPAPNRVELVLANSVAGINFGASVSLPADSDFNQAQWTLGQLISGKRVWKWATDGSCGKADTNGTFVNDNPWPYTAGAMPAPPPWNTGDPPVVYSVVDAPSQPLRRHTQVVGSNLWIMYIMFKPAPDPPGAGPSSSSWVPLRSILWTAEWCAQLVNNVWELASQYTSVQGSWSVNRDPPTWSTNWGAVPEEENVDCPPPASSRPWRSGSLSLNKYCGGQNDRECSMFGFAVHAWYPGVI